MQGKYVVFRLGEQRYGLPIERVDRIVPAMPVTSLPGTSLTFRGVVDLRGETIRVLDSERRFGATLREDVHHQFVVIRAEGGPCAITVDGVESIASLGEQQIEASPSYTAEDGGGFVAGIGREKDHLLLLIDPDALVAAA